MHRLLERGGEVAVVADVADELLGEEERAGREIEHLQLVAQVGREVGGHHAHRLDVLALLGLLAPAPLVEAREEDVLPVDRLGLGGLRGLLLLRRGERKVLVLLRLQQLEERVGEQLLLEVLLQGEQRHVQQVHGLVQPRIDPQVLPQERMLPEGLLHAAGARRARRRAVSVGPRYISATRSSKTSSRTVPETWTRPSNMM